jgi:hypothetical protein
MVSLFYVLGGYKGYGLSILCFRCISNSYNEMFEAQMVSFYVSTGTFVLLHCDEWDRVVALPRHKFVTGATLLQLHKVMVSLFYFLGGYRGYGLSILCFRWIQRLWSPIETITFVST